MYLRKTANSQVLIEQEPTSFPLIADKIKVIAEVVGSNPTRSTFSCCTTTVLNLAWYRRLPDNIARNAIEDTERLVTEIEMLKAVLYLVSRSRS
jgi:hypothetical protein